MANRVTCCPHCSTSFRITDTQLQSAKGAVRCGSCLKVFKALNHLLPTEDTDATTQESAPPQESAATPEATSIQTPEEDSPETSDADIVAPRAAFIEPEVDLDAPAEKAESGRLDFDQHAIDTAQDDDELLISDDMDKIEDTQNITLGNLSADFQSDHGSAGLFDREIKVSEPAHLDDSDESWAVGLLEDEETGTESAAEQEQHQEQQEQDQSTTDFDYSRATTGTFNALDDADIEAALGESLQSSERKEPIFSLVGDDHTTEEFDEYPADEYDNLDDDIPPEDDADESVAKLLQSIQPEPVEMEWHETSVWPQRLLWSGLSLLATLALMAQIGVYKFDDLSRIEPYRGLYAASCPILGCKLPSIADPARVKAYNLVIRSHPRTDNALVVDSILLNSAPFNQPFPDLLLNFSDIKGRPIAGRRFTPAEYLSGEMAGIKEMPSGQPVHISLDIIDPGPDAVNYSAEVPLN